MKKNLLYASAVALAFSVAPALTILANDTDGTDEPKTSENITENTNNPEDSSGSKTSDETDGEETKNTQAPDNDDLGNEITPEEDVKTTENEKEDTQAKREEQKENFTASLATDGYAEVGEYKVSLIEGTSNVYLMDEETVEDPGGFRENGSMNNPSSIYIVVEENEVLIVDGGNPIDLTTEADKLEDAAFILSKMTESADGTKKTTTAILTHSHYDHVGLFSDETLLEAMNLQTLYIAENDYIDEEEALITAKSTFDPLVEKGKLNVVLYDPTDENFTFSVGGKEYNVINFYAHTPGSVVIYNADNNVLFTGDSIGSGFVWLFWNSTDNTLESYEANLANLENIINDETTILAGHSWQEKWDIIATSPETLTKEYISGMRSILAGLKDGTTTATHYVSYGTTNVELTKDGINAAIDTSPELILKYLETNTGSSYVLSKADTLDEYSENSNAAPYFFIFADGKVTDEEADALIKELGIDEIIEKHASAAVVISPTVGDTYSDVDLQVFFNLLDSVGAYSLNTKVIGFGEGATFVNQTISQYDWMIAGIMTYGGEAGDTAVYTVPAYVSNSDASVTEQYVTSNTAEKVSEEGTITTYVNADNRFEIVVSNSAQESKKEAFDNAWNTIFSSIARIGNIASEGEDIGTWYMKPQSAEREFEYFDSVDAITNMNRNVLIDDLGNEGQTYLWYEYIPDEAVNAEDGTIPVVFLMHGNTNDPRMQYDTSGWATVASNENIILICPEWQGHTFGDVTYDAMTEDLNTTSDSTFITLVKTILEKYPQIDASRVYISGLSAGCANTTTNALVNTKYFAAAAGSSGPFYIGNIADITGISSEDITNRLETSLAANIDQYDIPIIYFTGDRDEYMSWDELGESAGLKTLQYFQMLNNMEVTTVDDLDENYLAVYGVPWTTYGEVENEGSLTIVGGSMTNDKGVTISMNRIYGWGHWNYPADAQLMWDFMKQYARDPETGETILLNKNTETPETPKDETPETPKDETPETPKDETTGTTSTTPAASTTTTASTSGAVNTAVHNNTFAWMGTMVTSLGAAAITLLKKKED
jgi:glyoxylase-like metal-dependent hydrolase (beta-lactamase superfamily II)/poly(3-hydroxybutyrate) depolymerase